MDPRNIFLFILQFNVLIIELKASAHPKVDEIRDNVLIIIVDDLRHLTDKTVYLPNIKKLAASGVKFNYAYAQQALCAPSRNSLLTGRRPDSLNLYDFYSYWRNSVGNFTTIPQYFKENGYETYSVGKIFHPGASSNFTDDYPYSWSKPPYHPPTDKYKDASVCYDNSTKKLQRNLICPVNVKEQPEHSLPDLQIINRAVQILQHSRNSSKPVFLAVGFHKPHIPLKFPKKYLERVPTESIQPPKFPFIPRDLPIVAWHPWTDVRHRDDIIKLNISFPFGTMPPNWTIKIMQSYYASAVYVDDLIGSLMKHVDMRKTIVVLTSDHGWSLGENGLWAKYSNFDVALRVPLIFNVPGIRSKSVNDPVELIDIFPSLVDLAKLNDNIPKCPNSDSKITLCFEGKSLVKYMKTDFYDQKPHKNIYAISQYPRPSIIPQSNSDKPRLKDIKIMGYSIRTKRYRYTEWVSFNNTVFIKDWDTNYGLELYDHIIDPNEAHNLYFHPKYKNVTKYLSKCLRTKIDSII